MTIAQGQVYKIIPGEGQTSCCCKFPPFYCSFLFVCNPFLYTAFLYEVFMVPYVQYFFLWLFSILGSDGSFLLTTWLLQDLLETLKKRKSLSVPGPVSWREVEREALHAWVTWLLSVTHTRTHTGTVFRQAGPGQLATSCMLLLAVVTGLLPHPLYCSWVHTCSTMCFLFVVLAYFIFWTSSFKVGSTRLHGVINLAWIWLD